MKNKNFSTLDYCKYHKAESEFICSCGDMICFSCIESHKTHNDFVLKTKKNIFNELNMEIKEIELNYEYISNSFQQEKILIKLVKDLTKKFFRKELKNSKNKEILKILSDMKISLNRANLEYKYDYRFPDNFEIKNIKVMIEKAKRNFLKKLNKIEKCADRILNAKSFFETEYEKLLSKIFSTDNNITMDIDENEKNQNNSNNQIQFPIVFNKIDNFQFTIGATRNFNPEGTDEIFSALKKEFVQSFYSNKEIDKYENYVSLMGIGEELHNNNNNDIHTHHENNNYQHQHGHQNVIVSKINYEEIESSEIDKKSTGLRSRNGDIQIPIIVSNNTLYATEIFDDKISVGKETENNSNSNNYSNLYKKDSMINSAVNSNHIYNYNRVSQNNCNDNTNHTHKNDNNNFYHKIKNRDETRPISVSNITRSPIRQKSPLQMNRVNSVISANCDIDMICLNPNCRKSYKVKRGDEKWKKKCLNCYKIEKAGG